jgi:cytochrome c oxidase subunit I
VGRKIQFKVPMLFCIGFLFQFLIAGLTGIMQGAAPFDWQLSLSYFVVAFRDKVPISRLHDAIPVR